MSVIALLGFLGAEVHAAPVASGCTAALTPAETQAAAALAAQIDVSVKRTLTQVSYRSNQSLEGALENAIEAVLETSDASPLVGRSALIQARTMLASQELVCAASQDPSLQPMPCDAVRNALDLATTAAQDAGRVCASAFGDGLPALGPPPPSGGGGIGPGVTHPSVSPPA